MCRLRPNPLPCSEYQQLRREIEPHASNSMNAGRIRQHDLKTKYFALFLQSAVGDCGGAWSVGV